MLTDLVLIAIKSAKHSAEILHRDISARNIMLNAAFEGILNDWDNAARVDGHSHQYRTVSCSLYPQQRCRY